MDNEEQKSHVRQRVCPGCRTKLTTFSLSAHMLPIEQNTINRLVEANRSFNWSIRSFGETSMLEFQYLGFTAVCGNCTLVSTWDFGRDELEEVLKQGPSSGIEISWNYNPEVIKELHKRAPDSLKGIFQGFVEAYAPPVAENDKK